VGLSGAGEKGHLDVDTSWILTSLKKRIISSRPRTDVMILKIFPPKKIAKNWRFWLRAKLNYAKF
jgi:hypothetical protein